MVEVEMYFLADLLLPCETCDGARYKPEILEVRHRGLNVRQALDLTVEEARAHFAASPPLVEKLAVLSDVGLGYLTLGQPAPTLSGGEAQRLKIARELSLPAGQPTLYLLDEPTVGLALADVARLLAVLDRLVERGHTVIVVEHNLELLKNADWIVDLGPGGGEAGGHVVAQGPPEVIARTEDSWTGRFLAPLLAGAAPGAR
jgi:excinuclease ABC subunit A